jgi:hypothetical protein
MKRRGVLLAAIGTVATAGCVGEQGEPTGDQTQGDDPVEERTGFELLGVDAPETVDVGEEWTWSVTIRNHGESTEVFQSRVSIYMGNGNWEEFNQIDFTIPSNDTRIFESPESFITDPAVARYRVDEFDETFDIRPSVEELSFGKPGLISKSETTIGSIPEDERNLQLSLEKLKLFDNIDSPENDGQQFEADDGQQFGTIRVNMENTAEETLGSLNASRLVVFAGNSDSGEVISTNASVRMEWIQSIGNVYQSENLEPGENTSGIVGFELPGEVSEDEVTAFVNPVWWGDSTQHELFYDNPARRISP